MKQTHKLSVLAAALIGSSFSAMAADRTHDITIDDFFDIGSMGSVTLSPNGKQAVWLESRWDKELDKSQRDLWLVEIKSRQSKRMTFTNESESSPQWSPDGEYVYYLGKIKQEGAKAPFNGKTQVFRLSVSNGDSQPITKEAEGVAGFELSHDGKSLYFLATKTTTDKDQWASMRASHSAPQYGHGEQKTNPLYQLDLEHFKQKLLLDDDKVVWEFKVSQDGSKVARITTTDNELVFLEGWSDVEIFDTNTQKNSVLADSQWRDNAPSPYGWLLGLAWQDNSELAFRIDYDGHPGQLFIADAKATDKPSLEVTRPGDVTLTSSDLTWRPNSDEICYRGADHGRVKLFCTEIDDGEQGDTRPVVPGDMVIGSYSFNQNGKSVAFSHNGLDHFSDMFIADANSSLAKAKRLTNINPQVDSWKLPQVSIVKWTAPDGAVVEGILDLPAGYKKEDGPLPLIVQIHGGPTAATPYALQHRSYGRSTFTANGWALLSPNYRGSTGYGDKFLTDLVGREHDIEVKDIMAGVDQLIADGIIDGDKMAVMGWSNGGYLTNALISTNNRFKAASSGAGVFDQRLQWILEDTPGHVVNFMEGLPWEKPEAYNHGSSLTYADQIKTPTLIHIGEGDQRVPLGHAQGLYRALHHYLNVPVELVVYPSEGHGLSKYQHRKAKMEWDQKWFNHYVLGQPVE
ncbi:peptidase S9 prolyl oligopeptidase active site domain protein [Shewanella halifaxensis HAW-EB4]|uniref:Peptidase S9 prolyl oligopeptidase active site domain protein n=1 Tax=Shewanella halifaxensis (strain HAW-EB4) TaxID=458817 RepID=B0TKF9_SHEHH|nr:S9 family peptidase [Shewanella halifaxensis]ABZ78545.1 peptidase S9 prolyl oligopeptidase active site domain protein [Shewanella halifaxensis HAW-EB4]